MDDNHGLDDRDLFHVIWTSKAKKIKYMYTFARKGVRDGILPKMLETLAGLRKMAKKALAQEETSGNCDPFLCDILNARQLSLKLTMNAIYGFTSTQMLPCKAVSASITARGRNMIMTTVNYINDHFPRYDVIYGDTDSVFINFNRPELTLEEIFKLATETAKEITTNMFKHPHDLEFEKVYHPFFLLKKKKYIGYKYVDLTTPPKIENKGVVLERRDQCAFVQETYKECRDLVCFR